MCDAMLKDLQPYMKYYEDFNLKSQALDFYEKRLDGIFDNEMNMKDMISTMSDKVREELADELSQTQLFSDDFYPLTKWL